MVLELYVVVLGRIEEFPEVVVAILVILTFLHVEVGNPAQLAKEVSFDRNLRPIGHSGAFHIVFFIGIKLTARLMRDV